jgi:hypothetical protein
MPSNRTNNDFRIDYGPDSCRKNGRLNCLLKPMISPVAFMGMQLVS